MYVILCNCDTLYIRWFGDGIKAKELNEILTMFVDGTNWNDNIFKS